MVCALILCNCIPVGISTSTPSAPLGSLGFTFGLPSASSTQAALEDPSSSGPPTPAFLSGLVSAVARPPPAAAAAGVEAPPAFSFGGQQESPADLAVREITQSAGAAVPQKPVRVYRFGLPPGSPPSSPDTARRSLSREVHPVPPQNLRDMDSILCNHVFPEKRQDSDIWYQHLSPPQAYKLV